MSGFDALKFDYSMAIVSLGVSSISAARKDLWLAHPSIVLVIFDIWSFVCSEYKWLRICWHCTIWEYLQKKSIEKCDVQQNI